MEVPSANPTGGDVLQRQVQRLATYVDRGRKEEEVHITMPQLYSFNLLPWKHWAQLRDLGQHVKIATGEPQSFAFLMQRLAVAIQAGNAISVLGTLGSCHAFGGLITMTRSLHSH